MVTTLYNYFSDAQGQLTLKSIRGSDEIRTHPTVMVVLITCKNEEDPLK